MAGQQSAAGTDALLAPLQPHLAALDTYLAAQIGAFEPDVQPLVRHTFNHSGKKIRPILVFSSGWRDDPQPSPDLVKAAAIMELVHLATLVHDDILDGASIRRRQQTAAARYGAHAAVLLGDALFAHALCLAAEFPDTEVCRRVAAATRNVCCGEIAQTFARGQSDLAIARYLRMIDLKTAELFAVASGLGALLVGHPPALQEAVAVFARHLGIAYQIYDDLADLLGDEAKTGKTLGTDLASGKFTLPVLLWLQTLATAERTRQLARISAGNQPSWQQELPQTGVTDLVRGYFQEHLGRADAALAPYAGTPQAACLTPLRAMVEAAFARLCKPLARQG
jgi:octaprenyl-diphosphate synthase